MKKLFFLLICIFFHSSYANEKNLYANIYADELIRKFDSRLELSPEVPSNILESFLYSQIVAVRQVIEKTGEVLSLGKANLLRIQDSKMYNEIVQEVDQIALEMVRNIKLLKSSERSDGYLIYPSVGPSGNLTGNTFKENVWSLTFDDGPRPERTEAIIKNLYRYDMKASFFMLTREAIKYQQSMNNVIENAMELGLHSYNHLDLSKSSLSVIDYEIGVALRELEALADLSISIFRLPYGAGMRNKKLRKEIKKYNLIHVFWNVDTLDWKDKKPESIYKRTIMQMNRTPKKSGIILFHDIHPQTVIASEMLMKYLQDNSKTVCTVGEVIKYINNLIQSCVL